MATKGRQVRVRAASTDERCAVDSQAMMLDGAEHPQACVGAVARYQHHLDPWLAEVGVEAKQLLHQREGITRRQHLVFVVNLVLTVGFNPLGQVDTMTVAEVEQGPRGDGDDEFVTQVFAHSWLLCGTSGSGGATSRLAPRLSWSMNASA
ncbi:hypothetical protein D3C80_1509390 [compost metagenome]